ncbi:hypothetical protein CEP52_005585 [Fusarium oligoseptatum]|uniref:Xylanolytic transcriptional activator regulatory domain-containing protein n=1 Tax=Fusarium oligoseptatum TaxID=2604345 RepID=A0A428TXI1_9HYPO|nr:hypothetical protein CEP52_005585 [Fusarium oligoseptatum]
MMNTNGDRHMANATYQKQNGTLPGAGRQYQAAPEKQSTPVDKPMELDQAPGITTTDDLPGLEEFLLTFDEERETRCEDTSGNRIADSDGLRNNTAPETESSTTSESSATGDHRLNLPLSLADFQQSMFLRGMSPASDSIAYNYRQPGVSNFVLFSSYSFVSADTLWNLDGEEMTFLEKQRCLYLPAQAAMDEFVQQYFLHVHPTLPLINEQDFWAMYNAQPSEAMSTGRVSLVVIQAMIFLACPFVPQPVLDSLSLTSVHQARAEFYSVTKTLFHIDGCRDDVSSAQSALMLTYHSPTIFDKTNSYWLSTAIHFARQAGADRCGATGGSPKGQAALKRLWWRCILRDRIMALSLWRPMQISLTDLDFDRLGPLEDDVRQEIRGSAVYDPATKRMLAQLVGCLCELSVVLNDILTICYTTTPDANDPTQTLTQLKDSVSRLSEWHDTVVPKFHLPSEVPGGHESLNLFTNAIYIYYFTAKACLNNHILYLIGKSGDQNKSPYAVWCASEELGESLQSITQSFADLEERNLVRYLPNTFVPLSLLPFLWHVSEAKDLQNQPVGSVQGDFGVYRDVFSMFGKLYEETDSVLKCTGIEDTER